MKKRNVVLLSTCLGFSAVSTGAYAADSLEQALTNGTVSGDFRLRYEHVKQDNALENASAVTLRSRLGYKTDELNGFSAQIEFEDSRVVSGQDKYNDANGKNAGVYSVIADPETTEVDQFNLQYKNKNMHIIAGRQVLTFDGHRHVGHVGWRQDRQTFDGVTVKGSIGNVEATYAHLESRNRIFAEDKDIDSDDNLVNVAYKTPYGKLTGYYYGLDDESVVGTASDADTKGLSFSGSAPVLGSKVLYTAEYAKQDQGAASVNYKFAELGTNIKGVTAKVGHEILGSDGTVGFATPLATLHKFNGWSDQFLATPAEGLTDTYVSVAGKVADGKLVVAYHDFSADEATATVDDLGNELNVSYAKKLGKHYSAGAKFAKYSAGDAAAGKVDTDKSWIWVGANF